MALVIFNLYFTKGMRTKIALYLLLAAALFSAYGIFAGSAKKEFSRQQEVPVRLAKPQVLAGVDEWEFSGFVRGEKNAVLSSKLGGQLLKVNASEGQAVRKGQLLATVDVREAFAQQKAAAASLQALDEIRSATAAYYEQLVDEAQANLEKAEKALEIAEKNDSPDQEMARKSVDIAEEAVRSAKRGRDLQLSATQGSVTNARGSLEGLEAVSSNGNIVAPFSGIITSISLKEGSFAPPGAGIISLSQPESLEIETYAPSAIAPLLQVGQQAFLSGGAEARIKAISPQADISKGKSLLLLSLEKKGSLRLGDFAEGKIAISSGTENLSVPLEAIVRRYEDDFVFVSSDGKAEIRKVRIVRTDASSAFISSGISGQDEIIIQGQHDLSDGVKIKAYE